ncbi:MAG: hypothetical protein BYD32DRAFT_454799 [Podila humilis]|nr:MAG: hypothetical protein BYD32DRAFT_454799 [Podila humilis]
MRQLLLRTATTLALAIWATVHAQIAVGCFQNQIDSSNGADTKSYQDIFMSQGACTNFCKGQGTAYAFTMDGSTCHCANQPPLDSNKVDDSKCDKPCMGYPFEMCGGSSSRSLANVLLIGGSTGAIPAPSSSSTSSTTDAKDSTSPTGSDKNLSANSPGTLTPDQPSPSILDNTKEKKKGDKVATPAKGSSDSGGPSTGAVVAGTMAILGFAVLFVFAVVFSKRRRQRLAQAAWTENMLLPSSLLHSSNDDELEGHDYTRSSPIYHHSKKQSQHSMPSPPANMHFPPPPVLHPRQSGPLHMQHPSYPPPMGPHYNSIRASYQPFPMPPLLSQYQQVPYTQDINHKEPVDSSFNRGPQAITDAHPNYDFEEEDGRFHRRDSRRQAPSVRTMSIRQDRSGRGSIDTSSSH